MSAERISSEDFFQTFLALAKERGERIQEAAAVFARGRPERTALRFAADTVKQLMSRYVELRSPTWRGTSDGLDSESRAFVKTVEGFADGLAELSVIAPPEQDDRRKKLSQLSSALQRVQDLLTTIDSGALAYAMHEIDKTLHGGKPTHATDPGEAFVVAGEVREIAGDMLSAMVVGATSAAKRLPKHDYHPTDQCLLALERLFDLHGLPFETKESGFAADCFRAMFAVANPGKLIDRPTYWLKKTADHPDSLASRRKKSP